MLFLWARAIAGDASSGACRRGQIRIETRRLRRQPADAEFPRARRSLRRGRRADGQPHGGTRPRGEPTELFKVLRREDFLGFSSASRGSRSSLIMLLCQRIRRMSERMEESVTAAAAGSSGAAALGALASDFGSEVHIPQEQLSAVFVGAAREKRQPSVAAWQQGRHSGPAARAHPVAEHDQAGRRWRGTSSCQLRSGWLSRRRRRRWSTAARRSPALIRFSRDGHRR